MRLDVRDFATVQDAFNATKEGDALYFPSLSGSPLGYYQAPVNGWLIDKSLEIFGDGPGNTGSDDSGTSIHPDTTSPNPYGDTVFKIQAPVDTVHIHDLKIRLQNSPMGVGSKHAISCIATIPNFAERIRIERVCVKNHGGDAFHFEGVLDGSTGIIYQVYEVILVDCLGLSCGISGVFMKYGNASEIRGGVFAGNKNWGITCEGSGEVRVIGVSTQGNQSAGTHPGTDTQLLLNGCHGFTVMGAHFEGFDQVALAKTAVAIENCFGGYIGNNSFYNTPVGGVGVSGSRGIFILTTSRAITVGPNVFDHTDIIVAINASDNNTNCVVLPQAVHSTDANCAGTITLPDQDANGNFAFIPTTKSSNIGAGILLPRVTTIVRDTSSGIPLQEGILIYNSAIHKLNFYDGTAWRGVISPDGTPVNLVNQPGAITATTVYAVPATGAGYYRVTWVAAITRVATTSSVLGGANGFQIIYTDPNDSMVKTSPAGILTSMANTLGTQISGIAIAYCKASTNLQYSFDYTSVGATTMQFDLSVRVEPMV